MPHAATWTFGHAHAALCTDAGRLCAAASTWPPTDRHADARIAATARWWRQYRDLLVAHHRAEERAWFPALLRSHTALDPADLAVLADDHRYIEALAARVDAALCRLADPTIPFEPARAAVVGATTPMARLLADHVAHEEWIVVSRIDDVLTRGAVASWCAAVGRHQPSEVVHFRVAWFFEHLAPVERAEALRRTDPATRLLYRTGAAGYRRLVECAGLTGRVTSDRGPNFSGFS